MQRSSWQGCREHNSIELSLSATVTVVYSGSAWRPLTSHSCRPAHDRMSSYKRAPLRTFGSRSLPSRAYPCDRWKHIGTPFVIDETPKSKQPTSSCLSGLVSNVTTMPNHSGNVISPRYRLSMRSVRAFAMALVQRHQDGSDSSHP